jgi:hypothetical protein
MYPDGKYAFFSVDLALAYTIKTTQQLLVEFWFPADWPPFLLDFNSLDFSI